jgi:lysophospholipase
MQTAPFFDDIARAPKGGIFEYRTCADGVRVRVAAWKGGNKGTVLIFQGRTEFIEKYGPVIQNFLDRGYCVATVDWRGHGLSDRMSDRPTLGHVEDFKEYQLDVAELLKFVEDQQLPEKFILFSHSMGGAIGLRTIQGGLKISHAIFSAPMWDIAVNGMGDCAIKIYARSLGQYMQRGRLVPTRNLRNASFTSEYDGNNLTNNTKEYAFRAEQLSEHPNLEIGGPSIGWVSEALADTRKLRNKPLPEVPTLCIVGTNENIVSLKAIREVMTRWETGELIEFEGAQHELLIETPDVTERIWDKIDQLLASSVQ